MTYGIHAPIQMVTGHLVPNAFSSQATSLAKRMFVVAGYLLVVAGYFLAANLLRMTVVYAG